MALIIPPEKIASAWQQARDITERRRPLDRFLAARTPQSATFGIKDSSRAIAAATTYLVLAGYPPLSPKSALNCARIANDAIPLAKATYAIAEGIGALIGRSVCAQPAAGQALIGLLTRPLGRLATARASLTAMTWCTFRYQSAQDAPFQALEAGARSAVEQNTDDVIDVLSVQLTGLFQLWLPK